MTIRIGHLETSFAHMQTNLASKTKGDVRLDNNEISISGDRRADVTGLGAWEPHVEGLALPNPPTAGIAVPVDVGQSAGLFHLPPLALGF